MMNQFPQWLPAEVAEHARHLIKAGGLNTLKPLLMRLVTNPEMEAVWKTLLSKTNTPQKLIDFLEDVRLHPSLQGDPSAPITIPSDKLQRKTFKAVSLLSLRLKRELSALVPSSNAEEGWALLMYALRRAELDQVDLLSKNLSSKVPIVEIKYVQKRLESIQHRESIMSLLGLIKSAADYASIAPDAALPKRRNTEKAKVNLFILFLKQYLHDHFNIDSPALIKTIVNTAFESVDAGVTEDDVRKLKPPARS